jgi:hypothetical protein
VKLTVTDKPLDIQRARNVFRTDRTLTPYVDHRLTSSEISKQGDSSPIELVHDLRTVGTLESESVVREQGDGLTVRSYGLDSVVTRQNPVSLSSQKLVTKLATQKTQDRLAHVNTGLTSQDFKRRLVTGTYRLTLIENTLNECDPGFVS